MSLRQTLVGSIVSLGFLIATLGNSALASHTPPALSNPTNSLGGQLGLRYYGGTAGEASVSAGGNATYAINIKTPHVAGGYIPDLQLRYNSNVQNGLVGMGWFLTGGIDMKITRCPKTKAQDGQFAAVQMNANDRFCLNGQRLFLVSGTYGSPNSEYRTESDQFSKIIAKNTSGNGPQHFEVQTKDGQVLKLGDSTSSRVESADGSTIRMWRLHRATDRAGNRYRIGYTEDTANGWSYPWGILANENVNEGTVENVRMIFYYENRDDIDVTYDAGSTVSNNPKRLEKIVARVDNVEKFRYTFEYEEVGFRKISRLTSVKRCYSSVCEDQLTIDWKGTGAESFSASNVTTLTNRGWVGGPFSNPQDNTPKYVNYPRWHDLNGDGKADYVLLNPTRNNDAEVDIAMSGPSGFTTETWNVSPRIHPYNVYFGDINADGRTDILSVDSYFNGYFVTLSTPTGPQTSNWGSPGGSDLVLADMNGDHLLDIVETHKNYSGYTWFHTIKVRLNTGSSFGSPQTWISSIPYAAEIADFDGDGLPDLMAQSNQFHRNNGSGFDAAVTYGTSAPLTPPNLNYPNTYWFFTMDFSDVNGDGKMDRLVPDTSGNWLIEINDGAGFTTGVIQTAAASVDFNRDRMKDRMRYLYDSYTGGSNLYVDYIGDVAGSTWTTQSLLGANGYNKYHGIGDINGDGLLDVSIKETWWCDPYIVNGGYQYAHACETATSRVFTNETGHLNLVQTITEGSGKVIEFAYKALTESGGHYTKGTSAVPPVVDVIDGTHVVTSLKTSNGRGGMFETTYVYKRLKWDLDRRTTLGFEEIISTNQDTGIATRTNYRQDFPFIMQPRVVRKYNNGFSDLLSRTEFVYDHKENFTAHPEIKAPYEKERMVELWDLDGITKLSTTTTTRIVDDHGNATSEIVEVQDHINTTLGTRSTETTNSFTNNTNNWQIGRLDSTVTRYKVGGSFSSGQDRTTNFYYFANGLLETIIREQGGGAGMELRTDYERDNFGNIKKETISAPGIDTRFTEFIYDPRGQFPETVINAEGHTTTQTWDPVFGNRLTMTDPNGLFTSWTYDALGTLEQETRPTGVTVNTKLWKDPTGSGIHATHYAEIIESGKPTRRVFFDVLGRTVREVSIAFAGDEVYVDTKYNSRGWVERKSEPYFWFNAAPWNIFGYDDIGRVTSVDAADDAADTTTVYNSFTTAVTDELARTEYRYTDASGRVIKTTDKAGTHTEFEYDAQGNRERVIAPSGTVEYEYDRLGRLEEETDPNRNRMVYEYDSLGNIRKEFTEDMLQNAEERSFLYDKLNRMKSRTDTDGTTTWIYDLTPSGSLGVGKIREVIYATLSSTYKEQFFYGPAGNGQLTSKATWIGSTRYSEAWGYNSIGQLVTRKHPNEGVTPGYEVDYTYNNLGYMERIKEDPVHGNPDKFLYQTLDTDAAGRLTSEWLGDGSTLTTGYDGYSSRILSQLSQNTPTVQNLSYTYDAVGNMKTRSDDYQLLTETFTYDSLDRLRTAQVASQPLVSYDFDASGNITNKSDLASTYGYGIFGGPHAVTSLTQGGTTRTLMYDVNGNFESGTGEPTVTWSSYNKPLTLSKSGIGTYTFEYGPDRLRYKKVRGGVTTHYIGGQFEREIGGTGAQRTEVHANGRAILIREETTSSTVHRYIHRDHLGSVTALTDEATGAVIQRMAYDAWGKRRHPNTWAAGTFTSIDHRGYTGHEHLDDIGVIHMNGRIYSQSIGRMLSPDPVTQAPENGQNYNRYSYAFNNPLKYTDPSGFQVVCGGLTEVDCGDVLDGFQPVWGNNNEDYDSLDAYLDFLFGDYDHLKNEPSFSGGAPELPKNSQGDSITGSGDVAQIAEMALEDGHLTSYEAIRIWRANTDPGFKVKVDASQLSVYIRGDGFNENRRALAIVVGLDDYAVHGQVTLELDDQGNIGILPGPYDFDPHSGWKTSLPVAARNLATYYLFTHASYYGLVEGTDFTIEYEGSPHVLN